MSATATTPTAAELRQAADDARRAANATATAATEARLASERGDQKDFPRLRQAEVEAHQRADAATKTFEAATVAWREERFRHYRPEIVAHIYGIVEFAEEMQRRIAALESLVAAAANDGVAPSMWPLDGATFPVAFGPMTQSVFARVMGPSYVSTCIERLRKAGWLAP